MDKITKRSVDFITTTLGETDDLVPTEKAVQDSIALASDALQTTVTSIQTQLSAAEQKMLEQEMELSYLRGRTSNNSNFLVEPFLDESLSLANYETILSNPAQIMDDNIWNNNWKEVQDVKGLEFKNGFMRPTRTSYMMENIDEYDLNTVGQLCKHGLSQYDAVNNCYWIISTAGSTNPVGEITKIGSVLKDGKVDIQGRWYLPANASGTWTGIDMRSDGIELTIIFRATTLTLSDVLSWKYNSTLNTLGDGVNISSPSGTYLAPKNYRSDATVDTTNLLNTLTCDSTTQLRVGMNVSGTNIPASSYITAITSATGFTINNNCTGTTPNITMLFWDSYGYRRISNAGNDIGYYNDVVAYDANNFMILCCNGTTNVNLIKIAYSDYSTIVSSITGFTSFIGGTTSTNRSITKLGNYFYIRKNDSADNRWIYKFDITNDIVSNVVIKTSGRFEIVRNLLADQGNGGIGTSIEGDILEVVTTASYGRFIARRAIRNALWAENQVAQITTQVTATTPVACGVDTANGDYWTGDKGVAYNAVKLQRFQKSTGTISSVTLTFGASGTATIWDMCFDSTYMYFMYNTSVITNQRICKVALSVVIAALGSTATPGTTTGWNILSNPNSPYATDTFYGMAYDSDSLVLLLLNDTDDKIDTVSIDGNTLTSGAYDLPTPTANWVGIAYKNGNIFINDFTNTTTPTRTYVLKKSLCDSNAWYRTHIYQDPSEAFVALGKYYMDFDSSGNAVFMHYTNKRFYVMKTLEDPDVMQVQTFMDSNNILVSNNVCGTCAVAERFFEPSEFADPRDCPDPYWTVVTYQDNGFSELHLAEYLAGRSSTGKPRYDVSTIRTRHYKKSSAAGGTIPTAANYNLAGNTTASASGVIIEKDLIILTSVNSNYSMPFLVIDLKSGRCTTLGWNTQPQYAGYIYKGSLTQRNNGLGYSGLGNTELVISSDTHRLVHARTFTKDDASDYNLNNPKTYVAFNTDGGIDILIIDWDSNNNRTLSKVLNAVFEIASANHTPWICQDGNLFLAAYGSNALLYKGIKPIWQASTDLCYTYSDTQEITTITPFYAAPFYIAPNSPCWKMPSGQWKHWLYAGISYNGGFRIVDWENNTHQLGRYDASSGYFHFDVYEDVVYNLGHHEASSGYFEDLMLLRKLSFNDGMPNYSVSNNARTQYAGWTVFEVISHRSRPRWGSDFNYINGAGLVVATDFKFSPLVYKLVHSSYVGVKMWHFYNNDQCEHQSMDFEIDSPSKYIYKQTLNK
jgi:hypothetical protein